MKIEKDYFEKLLMRVRVLRKQIPKKIFDRFYSNRPDTFGEHSGLGLNIVKNLSRICMVPLLTPLIILIQNGANVEIVFPKVLIIS